MLNTTAHILIVDDNPDNIRVLGSVLAQNKYKMTIAPNGILALKAAKEHHPDLILLDVMMPEMDGFQVCKTLKADAQTEDIEIIFVTAAVAQDDELKGLELGAVDYIFKPFSIPVIQAKVALHLERARGKKLLKLQNATLEENARLRDDIERINRHDLKTPLNAILGYPQLILMDDNLTDEQREYLQEVLRAGNEMNNMINSSLDLFKMETGCYSYYPDWVDIGLVIHTIIRDLKTLIEQCGVKMAVSQQIPANWEIGQTQNFVVLAEKNLSYSLFANLIRNAIEACSANDTVSIMMNYEGDEGVIAITNPGSVPEAIRDSFFDKYVTAGKTYGTGLGTYSAKLMTTTQKGSISMTTNLQETCVTVRLPYQRSEY
jgi:two-component system, sensor histidine kinase and response regulator